MGMRSVEWRPPVPEGKQPRYRIAEALPAIVEDYKVDPIRREVFLEDRMKANLICSDLGNGKHMGIIDLDLPCELVPSSTLGNYHLYIGKEMTWWRYRLMLWAMWRAGIVQKGFYKAAVRRGYSSVRPPWEVK